MRNTLYKDPILVTRPGTPGKAATPAYTVVVPREVCRWQPLGISPTPVYSADNPDDLIQGIEAQPTNLPMVFRCSIEMVEITVPESPAIPGTPDSQYLDANLGWNSGARSIYSLRGDGYIEFKVPLNAAGIVVGFSSVMSDVQGPPLYAVEAQYAALDYHPNRVDYGFYLERGEAKVVKNGLPVDTIGAYVAEDVFKIVRQDGAFSFQINDVEVYNDATDDPRRMVMMASLYSVGDFVDEPVIYGFSTAAMSFEEPTVFGGEGTLGQAVMSFEPMELFHRQSEGAQLQLESLLVLASDRSLGQAAMSLEELTMVAYAGSLQPTYAVCEMQLQSLQMGAVGYTGTIGSTPEGNGFQPMQMMASDRPYGEARMSMSSMRMMAHAYEGPDAAFLVGAAQASGAIEAGNLIVVSISSSGEVSATLVSASVEQVDMLVELLGAGTMQTGNLLNVIMRSTATVDAGVPVLAQPAEVWVLNMETGATTMYESYDFNSYASFNDVEVGARADGIYVLEGDDDDGEPVIGSINFGKKNFNTSLRKRVEHCYVGVAASGDMFLKVTVDGTSYTYQARRVDENLQTQRFDLGKGLKGTFYTFELFNDGGEFDLESVEFELAELTRRI